VGHQLTKAGRSPISTGSLTAATIRNFIDNFGFEWVAHSTSIHGPQSGQQSTGGSSMGGFQFIQGPGTSGFDPIAPLVPFTTPSSLASGGLPAGIVAPDWRELTRVAITALMGQGNDPISGGVMVPVPGAPGGSAPVPIGPGFGGLTGGCGRGAFRNRTPWIMGPNGFPTCPRGFHPLKNGQPFCVRNRRMNPLNPRALSRAGRRVGGFARAVKRARTLKRVCASL